ncbi:MAG: hypothetical protein WC358_02075 [Ignavibacteria bacterium]|jgi:hypothetical protein
MSCKCLLFFLFTFLSLINLNAQKISFPYPVTENNFISFPDTNFHCAYLKINENESSDFYFFISGEKNKGIALSDENFVNALSFDYFLMNFHFAFLTMKYNVIPYIHPDFAIKFLYILNKTKYYPRVSDAMRTVEDQLKYKRRGWSTVEDSPHMLGIAADLSYYTRYDRSIIQKYNQGLGIRFLEHGGRGNNHIHLQDDILWLLNKNISISNISDSLNNKISTNYNILKPYAENLYAEKFTDGIEINFNTENLDLIKVEFVTPFEKKQAEITAGVFEKGNHKFYIRTDFLRKGIYCIRVFKNGMYLEQKNLIKFDIITFSP